MKVVGMYSGGLDSILAAAVMRREGFDVLAVHFYNGFNGSVKRELAAGADAPWEPSPEVVESAERLGITLLPLDLSNEFTETLLHPAHGYGSGANPCIDCRVFFLKHARAVMEREEAILVFTGEVAGQRPMSQQRNMLRHVERASGLEGRLLRPLSAKLLEPTIPEREGLVNRDHLYDFSGRSRTPQQELARELGIDYYPSSGGGCHLTEVGFAHRFTDLVEHLPDREPAQTELYSLKTGRHLRLPGGLKLVVGRDQTENEYLSGLFGDSVTRLHAADVPGAEVFGLGAPTQDDLMLAASIAARYSKARDALNVRVTVEIGNEIQVLDVKPATQEMIDPLLVH